MNVSRSKAHVIYTIEDATLLPKIFAAALLLANRRSDEFLLIIAERACNLSLI